MFLLAASRLLRLIKEQTDEEQAEGAGQSDEAGHDWPSDSFRSFMNAWRSR